MRIHPGILSVCGVVMLVGCQSAGPAPPPSKPTETASRSTPQPPPPEPAAAPAPAPAPPPESAPPPRAVMVPDSTAASAAAPASPAAVVPPQAESSAAGPRPWEDILRLKQSGLSDEFILNKIRTDDVAYHLTTADILQLRSAGISETILAAMLRSGQAPAAAAGAVVARRAEFPGLSRVGKGFLVFGTSTKDVGRLVVDGDTVTWYDADPKKNFSVYAKNVKEIFNTCVLRPGQNLCLEFGFVTYTGEEYRFRDPGWKNGENRLVREATSYFRQVFPQLFFSERAVSEL
jgi:hypothetical protein